MSFSPRWLSRLSLLSLSMLVHCSGDNSSESDYPGTGGQSAGVQGGGIQGTGASSSAGGVLGAGTGGTGIGGAGTGGGEGTGTGGVGAGTLDDGGTPNANAKTIRFELNGQQLTDLALSSTDDWNTWTDHTIDVFLTAGINRLTFKAYTTDESDNIRIDYVDVAPNSRTFTSYEAESSANTLSGTAAVASSSGASGGQAVGYIGEGAGNTLQFNNVNVAVAGTYRMVVHFANAEFGGDHAYNSQVVDRYAEISVNGGAAQGYFFRNTFDWDNFQTRVVDVELSAGDNTIRFGNTKSFIHSSYAPDIDRIDIALPLETNQGGDTFEAPVEKAPPPAGGQPLVVDLASDTGPLKYGATGALYGMGREDVPSANVLTPLRPQVIAQKPEGGLQHPNGDAINVSQTYLKAGGREIEIYMQDMYAEWPYENLGIQDYLNKVESIAQGVVATPNPELFSYVLFNEPDWIWYGGNTQGFLNDYKAAYDKLKSVDPNARTVAPGVAAYNEDYYRNFLTYCRDNNCLPDVVSWHELGSDFFSAWYGRVAAYRALEQELGISEREIVINEYGRQNVDMGVPGLSLQWIARFETSKVDACAAYWSSAGTFGDLVAQDNYNKATGAWWAYKWYGEMTGHTVTVTPPDANAEGLQGVASFDSDKKQARVLFGGSSSASVTLQGIDAAIFGSSVHATVWEVASTDKTPSPGPSVKLEGDFAVSGGKITVPIGSMVPTSGYFLVATPGTSQGPVASEQRYEAEYANLDGSAKITYGSGSGYSGTYFVEGYDSSADAETTFVVTAQDNGYHSVRLRYSAAASP